MEKFWIRDKVFVSREVLRHMPNDRLSDVLGSSMPMLAMTIHHCEKVHTLRLAEIWCQSVTILVNLVWVVRLVTTAGGESKLCDNVESRLFLNLWLQAGQGLRCHLI